MRLYAWLRSVSTAAVLLAPALLGAQQTTIRVLDVGQGDATLITTPNGQHILVDAGPNPADVLRRITQLGVRRLALVVATHQHADHIGGMAEVLTHLRVDTYRDNGSSHPTATARRVFEALQARQVPYGIARRERFEIDGVQIELFPGAAERREAENDKTIGVLIRFGRSSAFIAGDGEAVARNVWERDGLIGPIQLLRVGHHGASNGTDIRFLRRIRPTYAAISVGANNSYGHPHDRAIRYLEAAKAIIYRTDRHGELVFRAAANGQWTLPTESALR